MSAIPAEESDQLLIRPLGAGQEVGRSCIILEFKGRKIMLDCGIHPGLEGMDALPYIDLIDPAEIDLLLISHFHLDHCGALPWFLQKTSFKGRTFMTHATKAIYRWLLSDYVKVSNISADDMLYTETDLEESMDKIETINFHEVKEVAGIKFWCYHAGHVLGAAMFMIEIAGVKLLYTGDFSRQEDRWLANPSNDMYADTVTTVILEVQSNPKIRKGAVQKVSKKLEMHVYSKRLEVMLQDIFGEDCVSVKDDSVLSVTVDGKTANINLETRAVECEEGSEDDESLREMVELAAQRLYEALTPVH